MRAFIYDKRSWRQIICDTIYVDETTYVCGDGGGGVVKAYLYTAATNWPRFLIGVLSKRASDAILIDTPIYGTHAIKIQFSHTSK